MFYVYLVKILKIWCTYIVQNFGSMLFNELWCESIVMETLLNLITGEIQKLKIILISKALMK